MRDLILVLIEIFSMVFITLKMGKTIQQRKENLMISIIKYTLILFLTAKIYDFVYKKLRFYGLSHDPLIASIVFAYYIFLILTLIISIYLRYKKKVH